MSTEGGKNVFLVEGEKDLEKFDGDDSKRIEIRLIQSFLLTKTRERDGGNRHHELRFAGCMEDRHHTSMAQTKRIQSHHADENAFISIDVLALFFLTWMAYVAGRKRLAMAILVATPGGTSLSPRRAWSMFELFVQFLIHHAHRKAFGRATRAMRVAPKFRNEH